MEMLDLGGLLIKPHRCGSSESDEMNSALLVISILINQLSEAMLSINPNLLINYLCLQSYLTARRRAPLLSTVASLSYLNISSLMIHVYIQFSKPIGHFLSTDISIRSATSEC